MQDVVAVGGLQGFEVCGERRHLAFHSRYLLGRHPADLLGLVGLDQV